MDFESSIDIDTIDDFNFAEKFTELKNHLDQQMKEEEKLNSRILKNLSRIDT